MKLPIKKTLEAEEENLDRWLLTYADLITLLLAFFIIMYGIAKIDAEKFKSVKGALENVLKGGKNPIIAMPKVSSTSVSEVTLPSPSPSQTYSLLIPTIDRTLLELYHKMSKFIAGTNMKDSIKIVMDEIGIRIRVADSLLFSSGSAEILPQAKKILKDLSIFLESVENQIQIEGHTDNVPIHSTKYPSNWELSTARASSVVVYLIEKYHFSPQKLLAAGYGEYKPIASNKTPEGRKANRRVEIVILKTKEKN